MMFGGAQWGMLQAVPGGPTMLVQPQPQQQQQQLMAAAGAPLGVGGQPADTSSAAASGFVYQAPQDMNEYLRQVMLYNNMRILQQQAYTTLAGDASKGLLLGVQALPSQQQQQPPQQQPLLTAAPAMMTATLAPAANGGADMQQVAGFALGGPPPAGAPGTSMSQLQALHQQAAAAATAAPWGGVFGYGLSLAPGQDPSGALALGGQAAAALTLAHPGTNPSTGLMADPATYYGSLFSLQGPHAAPAAAVATANPDCSGALSQQQQQQLSLLTQQGVYGALQVPAMLAHGPPALLATGQVGAAPLSLQGLTVQLAVGGAAAPPAPAPPPHGHAAQSGTGGGTGTSVAQLMLPAASRLLDPGANGLLTAIQQHHHHPLVLDSMSLGTTPAPSGKAPVAAATPAHHAPPPGGGEEAATAVGGGGGGSGSGKHNWLMRGSTLARSVCRGAAAGAGAGMPDGSSKRRVAGSKIKRQDVEHASEDGVAGASDGEDGCSSAQPSERRSSEQENAGMQTLPGSGQPVQALAHQGSAGVIMTSAAQALQLPSAPPTALGLIPLAAGSARALLSPLGTPGLPAMTLQPLASMDMGVAGEPMNEKEAKKEKRKQSNRDSARRSRLRKQAEMGEVQERVEWLSTENDNVEAQVLQLRTTAERLDATNAVLRELIQAIRAPPAAAAAMEAPPEGGAWQGGWRGAAAAAGNNAGSSTSGSVSMSLLQPFLDRLTACQKLGQVPMGGGGGGPAGGGGDGGSGVSGGAADADSGDDEDDDGGHGGGGTADAAESSGSSSAGEDEYDKEAEQWEVVPRQRGDKPGRHSHHHQQQQGCRWAAEVGAGTPVLGQAAAPLHVAPVVGGGGSPNSKAGAGGAANPGGSEPVPLASMPMAERVGRQKAAAAAAAIASAMAAAQQQQHQAGRPQHLLGGVGRRAAVPQHAMSHAPDKRRAYASCADDSATGRAGAVPQVSMSAGAGIGMHTRSAQQELSQSPPTPQTATTEASQGDSDDLVDGAQQQPAGMLGAAAPAGTDATAAVAVAGGAAALAASSSGNPLLHLLPRNASNEGPWGRSGNEDEGEEAGSAAAARTRAAAASTPARAALAGNSKLGTAAAAGSDKQLLCASAVAAAPGDEEERRQPPVNGRAAGRFADEVALAGELQHKAEQLLQAGEAAGAGGGNMSSMAVLRTSGSSPVVEHQLQLVNGGWQR